MLLVYKRKMELDFTRLFFSRGLLSRPDKLSENGLLVVSQNINVDMKCDEKEKRLSSEKCGRRKKEKESFLPFFA